MEFLKNIKLPAFGETEFFHEIENAHSQVITVENADASLFDKYCALFEGEGFDKKEERANGKNLYASFSLDGFGIFINYFGGVGELSLAVEEQCRYFDYRDVAASACVSPQITQIALEDFGMSYVIRLSDGRFIVIDGGREFEIEADKLFTCLKSNSPFETPIIAAWIMSHPHSDHFFCFIPFMDKYADSVKIEKFIFNFPEADDLVHYPNLAKSDKRVEYNASSSFFIPRMMRRIERSGADVYTAHTGQTYKIGDAVCEMLATMDDTIHLSDNINAAALVIRMELGSQVILWATDASFSKAKLPEKYGTYLKADILQVPHHGFQCGTAEGEIQGYDLILPKVCFLSVMDYNAYMFFCTYRKGTRYLYKLDCVEEIITGDEERTINLPYSAPRHAKRELEYKFHSGLENNGARTWIYTGLSTDIEEDFVFTVLNASIVPAVIWIELFFEDSKNTVRFIKAEVKGGSLKTFSIVGEEVDNDARYFNSDSLKNKGIPKGVPFAARFICDIPVVVSHKTHRAAFHSSLNE